MVKKSIVSMIAIFALQLHLIVAPKQLIIDKSGENDSSEEFEDNLVMQLRNDYKTGLRQIIIVCDSINTALQNLTLKVEQMEAQLALKDAKIASLKKSFGTKLQQLRSDTNFHVLLPLLPEPKAGESFNGSSLDQVLQDVPTKGVSIAIAIQIRNLLDVSLSTYQHHIYQGQAVLLAPSIINPKTAEVFTFNQTSDRALSSTFLYRIDDTEFALHVYFSCGTSFRQLTAAFVSNFTSPKIVYAERNVTTSSPGAFASTKGVVSNVAQVISLNVSEGGLSAKANMEFVSRRRFTLSIDFFGYTKNP